MFKEYTQKELIELDRKSLSEGYLNSKYKSKSEKDEAIKKVIEYIKVWKESAREMKDSEEKTKTKIIGGEAKKVFYSKKFLAGDLIQKACFYALSISQSNTLMGRVVAAPTAGSSGVIPGVVLALQEKYNFSDEQVARSVFAGMAIGEIIHERASFAGAVLGCQAEIGSATAMAAAIATDLMKGTSKQSVHAASLALKNMLGLTCDPVACLVEIPCVKRNPMAASYAITASSLAMCGIESKIPFHEIVNVMQETGNKMDVSLKETSKGGLAMTPTGLKILKKIKKI
jgi:L-serine dehydratase